MLERVAQPAQDLQLQVGAVAAGQLVVGDRVRDRAQVVAGDRHAQRGTGVEQPARQHLEVAVRVGLDLEHRRAPAVLYRLDDLVVPVRALDEPHGQRVGALGTGAVRPVDHGVERLRRVAQVGLQDHAGRRAVAELRLGEQLEDELEHRVARVERLHVDVQVGAELARAAQEAAQPVGGVALAALGRVGAQQRRERRDLDREVRARERAGAVALERGALRPAARLRGERLERLGAALRVALA